MILALSQAYCDQYYRKYKPRSLILDLDFTHFDTFGRQEMVSFNKHYNSYGLHPMVLYDLKTGFSLGAQLRTGSAYTFTGSVEFLKPILTHLIDDLGITDITLRADSGFAMPDLMELCESLQITFIIRDKAYQPLKDEAKRFYEQNPEIPAEHQERLETFKYQAKSWDHARDIVLYQDWKACELFPKDTFILTNCDLGDGNEARLKEIAYSYQARGNMENCIKEAKTGFFMDKTDSTSFKANEKRMWVGILAYNIIAMMRLLTFSKAQKSWTISTIRQHLIKCAGRVIRHAHQVLLKIDESFVYQEEYFDIGKRVCSLSF
jgi:hypothetical protein